MQRVATYVTADGAVKDLVWDAGRFLVDGYEIPLADVLAWDDAALLSWASPETQAWARSLAAPVSPAAAQSAEAAATQAPGAVGATAATPQPADSGRDALVAAIRNALEERTGYEVLAGQKADLEIRSAIASANWGTGAKKVDYEAVLSVSEPERTVYFWEIVKERGGGLSFGTVESESWGVSGFKRSGAKKETVAGPQGVALDYSWDYAKTRGLVEHVCAAHGYALKVVLRKSKAER